MIPNIDMETFVAFMDISGFKELMDKKKALNALNEFYQSGFDILRDENIIHGLFVSDCAILFVSECDDKVICLSSLLKVIKKINVRMLKSDFMLTTSIAYGQFKYKNRISFVGLEKHPIYGGAYLNAFLDNENITPKIQPGQCRIITTNIQGICQNMRNSNLSIFMNEIDGDDGHLYYYWSIDDYDEIQMLEDAYKKSTDVKYTIIKNALNRKKTMLDTSNF